MDIGEVGSLIRQERKRQSLSQESLAAACGLSRATVNGLESGKVRELGFGRVAALGDRLGLDVAVLPKGRPSDAGACGSSRLLRQLRHRYIWWRTPEAEPDDERVIAQVMDIGTYADVKRLEREVGRIRLRQVLADAEPGWLSPQSRDFWRLVLGLAKPGTGSRPPRRIDGLRGQTEGAAR